MARPWERLPTERAAAYARFEFYMNLGEARTLPQVAEHFGVAIRSVERQSGKYKWVSRAAARDSHLANERVAAEVDAQGSSVERWAARQEELREKEWTVALRLLERLNKMLEHPLFEVKDTVVETDDKGNSVTINRTIVPARWTENTINRHLKVISDVLRRAAGLEAGRHVIELEVSNDIVDRAIDLMPRATLEAFLKAEGAEADEILTPFIQRARETEGAGESTSSPEEREA